MLQIQKLTKKFHGKIVVDQLDMHVAKGEIYGFLGPNGAGKTTTIKMITGLLRPDGGSVTINGFDLQNSPIDAKKSFGFVSDEPFLYDSLTPREFLRFIGGIYRISAAECEKRIDYWLAQFDLADYGEELIGAFSHGMRQKIVFSSALLPDPPLLVIDEPMVGLDPKGVVTVKAILREWASSGKSVLITTHSMDVAEQLADRIGILHKGRLLAEGSMAEFQAMVQNRQKRLEEIFLQLTEEEANEQPIGSGR